jgi:hypothetical protein
MTDDCTEVGVFTPRAPSDEENKEFIDSCKTPRQKALAVVFLEWARIHAEKGKAEGILYAREHVFRPLGLIDPPRGA